MGQTTNSHNSKTYAAVLIEGFLKADSIYKLQKEHRHLRRSKKLIKGRPSDSRSEIKRLKSTIRCLEVKTANTKQELQYLNDEVVRQISSQFSTASDIMNVLDPKIFNPEVPDPHELLDMKPFKDTMESLEERCKEISAKKLDAIPHGKELFAKAYQADDIIISNLRKAELDFDRSLKQVEAEANSFEMNIKHWSSEESIEYLVDKTRRRLLGQKSLEEEQKLLETLDLDTLVKKSLDDYIGEIFVAEMIRETPKNIYPSVVNSLQVREAAVHPAKITQMHPSKVKENLKRLSKDSEDKLLSMQENLDSRSLIKSYNQLGYLERVLSNQAEVLSFINAPDGQANKEIYMGDFEEAKDIPPEISLYEQDVHISNALRTSIVQCTENWFFSDISMRVEALEKKVLNNEGHSG